MWSTYINVLLLSSASRIVASKHPANSSFTNPILPGFHPDPSCIFVPELDDTFFCASSSFNAFPGIPIHASKNLQDWKLIGNVLNREAQLPALGTVNSTTGGVWAPSLRYQNGTFWVVTTLVFDDYAANDSARWDNIIFKGKDPYDEISWSDAVHFNFTGYDTSPFWDIDGQTYMVGSHAYHIYPAIQLTKVNLNTGETGEWMTIWNGTGGVAPEGPHIYRKDNMYYLMIAEGGTGASHMETMARSSNLTGPYESNPANPVLTAANTTNFFQTVGHADLFQDPSENWWAVALATREVITNNAYHPMGRETILTPVTWDKGEWPIFSTVEGLMKGWARPAASDVQGDGPWISNGDDIEFAPGSTLPLHFTYWRFTQSDAYIISPPDHPYTLQINPSVANLTFTDGKSAPSEGISFLGRRQQDTIFTYSVNLDYSPKTINEEAGVTVFLQQNAHLEMAIILLEADTPYLRVKGVSTTAIPNYETPLPSAWMNQTLHLEIKALNWTHYSFSAGPANSMAQMKTLAYAANSAVSAGFTGTIVGVYVTSNGGTGNTPAYFSNWSYVPQGQFLD